MNVPEGFKQTEVGVIPKDWEIVALGENVTVNSGESPSKFKILASGISYFKVDELNNSSKYADKSRYCIEYCKSVPEGSLIFPKRGASIFLNKIRILKQPSYMDTNLMTLTVSKNWEHEYIYYQLLYIGLWKVADITSVPQINNKHIIPFQIPLPPTRAEQTAIAAALSDMDALIEGVEKLLEKKRRIKQGAMQELLTGKRRVNGFESQAGFQQTEVGVIPKDWGLTSLVEHIAALDAGVSVNSVDEKLSILGHSESVLKTSCVYNGYFHPEECKKILKQDVSRAKLTPKKKSIIISRMNTPALVGECGYIDRDYPSLFLPDRLWQTSFKKDAGINTRWLAYILSFGEVSKAIKETATGTSDTMKNISKNALLKVTIPYPTKAEQTAIAAILSDMDAEIEQLETQLTKYRQLKTGMMQELLTGKKRLV